MPIFVDQSLTCRPYEQECCCDQHIMSLIAPLHYILGKKEHKENTNGRISKKQTE